MEARNHSKNEANLKRLKRLSIIIIVLIFIPFSYGMVTAQDNVSNIRIQQREALLYVTYDLEEQADIEVYVSFDNGLTFRNRRLRQVSGEVGRGINPGKDKVLIWNVVREVGYVNYSNIVIKIVANAVTVTSTVNVTDADVSIEQPQHSRFCVGVVGGVGIYQGYWSWHPTGLNLGLNAAYFFNYHLGVGLAAHHFGYTRRNEDDFLKCTFFGPVFYGNAGKSHWKFYFPLNVGLGGYSYDIHYNPEPYFGSYDYRRDKGISAGYFLSVGIAYKPQRHISIGLIFEFSSDLGVDYGHHQPFSGINLGLNFHF